MFFEYSPGVWAFSADVSELSIRSIFIGVERTLYTYEDGTDSKFRNVGTKSSDVARLLKKHNITLRDVIYFFHVKILPTTAHWEPEGE